MCATIAELLEAVFSTWSDLRIKHVLRKRSRQQAEVIQNHENVNVRNIGQGEGRHRKYKRLKLGGGQAYDRSND
jgi:hypothetical protein